jgi:hypothetical protein
MAPLIALLLQQGLSLAASAVATKGVEYVKEKTGVDIKLGQQEITEEDLTKLRQAELENEAEWRQFRLAELEAEEKREKIAAEDRGSARAMQIAALGSGDWFARRFVYIFIAAWSLFSMTFLLLVTLAEIPEANVRVVDTILGFLLGTALAAVFNYLLGSTARSSKKDDTIQTLAKEKSNERGS